MSRGFATATKPTGLFAAILVALIAGVMGSPCHAADRATLRFQRLLEGRHDAARVAALNSIPTDFQSRRQALPAIIESLEKLSTDSRFRRAESRGETDLPDGVLMMINFIGTLDLPEATDALTELLSCERITWAMAAADTLGKHQHHDAIDPLLELADSEHFEASYGFRFMVARGLKQMEHPDAWEALASLQDRIEGQLAHRMREEFATVTVHDFLDDQERFDDWRTLVGLKKTPPEEEQQEPAIPLPAKMGLKPSKTASAYLQPKLAASKYYGIDIWAKRMLFVIDRSGSMNAQVGYLTRIERAKRELITAIQGLEPDCEFSILVFDTDVRPWKENLVLATDDNKQEAIRYVRKLSAGESTNTYAALRRSLNFDDQLEAVFMLTDGMPTYGLLKDPEAILKDVLRRNETRNVTINTIAIAVDPLMQVFLKRLAAPSDGEFRAVD